MPHSTQPNHFRDEKPIMTVQQLADAQAVTAPASSSASESSARSRDSSYLSSDKDVSCDDASAATEFDACRKPQLPYRVGFRFTAVSHQAPSPSEEADAIASDRQLHDWRSMSQIERCFTDKTAGDRMLPYITKDLEITSLIRTGHDRGAQVVVVNDEMVAKIYDPFYYSDNENGFKHDVVRCARGDYSREVAAYLQLQTSDAAKAVTPVFHGSWTAEITTAIDGHDRQESHTRIVQLILIEHLQGECMQYVNPRSMSERG